MLSKFKIQSCYRILILQMIFLGQMIYCGIRCRFQKNKIVNKNASSFSIKELLMSVKLLHMFFGNQPAVLRIFYSVCIVVSYIDLCFTNEEKEMI